MSHQFQHYIGRIFLLKSRLKSLALHPRKFIGCRKEANPEAWYLGEKLEKNSMKQLGQKLDLIYKKRIGKYIQLAESKYWVRVNYIHLKSASYQPICYARTKLNTKIGLIYHHPNPFLDTRAFLLSFLKGNAPMPQLQLRLVFNINFVSVHPPPRLVAALKFQLQFQPQLWFQLEL